MIAGKGLNSASVTAHLPLSRFGLLVSSIGNRVGALVTPLINSGFTAAYGQIVADLNGYGFSTEDADSIAKTACLAGENAWQIGGITSTLVKQVASAAGLARALGILATPGCDTECACETETAMAAALAQVPAASQVAMAATMWADMLNIGTIN